MSTKVRKLGAPPVGARVSAEEWQVRVNLAACYRLAAHFDYRYYLERACQAQISALAGGVKLRMPPREIAEKVARQFRASIRGG